MIWDSNNGWVQIGGDVNSKETVVTGPVEVVLSEKRFKTYNNRYGKTD